MEIPFYKLRLNVSWILKATGFRFSKSYRHGETVFHRAVYAVIDTVGSNQSAGRPDHE